MIESTFNLFMFIAVAVGAISFFYSESRPLSSFFAFFLFVLVAFNALNIEVVTESGNLISHSEVGQAYLFGAGSLLFLVQTITSTLNKFTNFIDLQGA